MYQVKSEQFSGPMELLLQLIEKQQLEITEISIAQVTDQYLAHIEKMENKDPEELADFLVIAARLLLIKSRALLPYLEQEEEVDDLERQLKLYKEFIEASKKINAMVLKKRFTFSRSKMPAKTEIEFSPPEKLKLEDLKASFLIVLKKLDPLVKLPRIMMEKTVSLQKTIMDISNFLKNQGKLGFNSLIKGAKNKTEVIINFLALLELLKQARIKIKQKKTFEDIIIERI